MCVSEVEIVRMEVLASAACAAPARRGQTKPTPDTLTISTLGSAQSNERSIRATANGSAPQSCGCPAPTHL